MSQRIAGYLLLPAALVTTGLAILATSVLAFGPGNPAAIRRQINHQGVVSVGGSRFNGTGVFRFAIMDPDTGNYMWTNDGSSPTPPAQPTGGVSVPVINGVYSVALGDDLLTNMTSLPIQVFSDNNVTLRIWFNDGINGSQQITPDQRLMSSPYAFNAATSPPIGSIVAWHKNMGGVPQTLPDGWLPCDGPLTDDPATSINEADIPPLNSVPTPYQGGYFLRGGSTSGVLQPGTLHFNDWDHDGFTTIPKNGNRGIINSDGTHTEFDEPDQYVQQLPPSQAAQRYEYSRPLNMSVIWIIRVK